MGPPFTRVNAEELPWLRRSPSVARGEEPLADVDSGGRELPELVQKAQPAEVESGAVR